MYRFPLFILCSKKYSQIFKYQKHQRYQTNFIDIHIDCDAEKYVTGLTNRLVIYQVIK